MLWSHKHSPKKLADIAGNSAAIAEVSAWAAAWEKGKRQKPLLLYGPPGIGKTAIARATANEMGWDFLEMNAGELRNKDAVSRKAGNGLTLSSLTSMRRLLLIDDVENMFRSDRGGMAELVRLIETATQPLILTAEDLWDPKLAPLRKSCKGIALSRIAAHEIEKLLAHIAKEEGAKPSKDLLLRISSSCNGDARSAVNDLQAALEGGEKQGGASSSGFRNRGVDVKSALSRMFAAKDFTEARSALFDVDIDREMLFKWIDENVPRELGERLELALAYESISRASLFDGRAIRRQYYALWRYSGDLMSAGVALSRRGSPAGRASYQFPKEILHLSRTRASRAIVKSASAKIAKACHVSIREARAYFPLISVLSLSGAGRGMLKEGLGLADEEIVLMSSLAGVGFKK